MPGNELLKHAHICLKVQQEDFAEKVIVLSAEGSIADYPASEVLKHAHVLLQVLQEGIPKEVQETNRVWKPAVPLREQRKPCKQLQGQHNSAIEGMQS